MRVVLYIISKQGIESGEMGKWRYFMMPWSDGSQF